MAIISSVTGLVLAFRFYHLNVSLACSAILTAVISNGVFAAKAVALFGTLQAGMGEYGRSIDFPAFIIIDYTDSQFRIHTIWV